MRDARELEREFRRRRTKMVAKANAEKECQRAYEREMKPSPHKQALTKKSFGRKHRGIAWRPELVLQVYLNRDSDRTSRPPTRCAGTRAPVLP